MNSFAWNFLPSPGKQRLGIPQPQAHRHKCGGLPNMATESPQHSWHRKRQLWNGLWPRVSLQKEWSCPFHSWGRHPEMFLHLHSENLTNLPHTQLNSHHISIHLKRDHKSGVLTQHELFPASTAASTLQIDTLCKMKVTPEMWFPFLPTWNKHTDPLTRQSQAESSQESL